MSKNCNVAAIDLFCGAGGLTYGLELAGISVKLGVDINPICAHAIEFNSNAQFLQADVAKLTPELLRPFLNKGKFSLLVGCAPCQPFSTYSRAAKHKHGANAQEKCSDDWRLVEHFGNLIRQTKPDLISMENVPPLAKQSVFEVFLAKLEDYWVDWKVVQCSAVGLPQTRKRLVLVASRLGPISIPDFGSEPGCSTVRSAIGDLPKLKAGAEDSKDRLHKASRLSEINLERIKHSVPGGSWRDWPITLRTPCHIKESGATYPSVYGRMEWDKPAPTITTQCFGYGNGRFGHPEQDRAISIREAAMLQGFPRDYSFLQSSQTFSFAALGKLIGNAVPVTLGERIGDIIIEHTANY